MTSSIIISNFHKFSVYSIDDTHSFIHINISDKKDFLNEIVKYILDESNLLQYAKNNTEITFSPLPQHFSKLYKTLYKFIDEENIEKLDNDDLKQILIEENELLEEGDENFTIRLSKVGRIGEYMFHIILSKYFNYSCVIPKISLTTDNNMSVYGIDSIFLDKEKRMLLFGESKFSKNLDNGIKLINKSLGKYEKEIKEEFILTLSEDQIIKKGLSEVFNNKHEVCNSFEEFIKEANITTIGIPIFIAHGNEVEYDDILTKLKKNIKKEKFFDLETIYVIISLPIIHKQEFLEYLTSNIRDKINEYEYSRA